jgi:hypothetical protein
LLNLISDPTMNSILPYVVPVLLLGLIVRRSGRPRSVNTGRMWVAPAIYAAIAISALLAEPFPGVLAIMAFAAATLAGVGLGYLRARHLHLTIDPKTGKISSRATTLGSLLIVALFAVRFGLKSVFPDMASHGHAAKDVTLGANILLLFTVAMMITNTIMVWRRTRPLLAAHKAGTLEAQPEPAAGALETTQKPAVE